ncbi:TetR/AcrR family transcriptional regulator [Curtobacterium sp. MCLR17_007]|uniref:TetR/AcrR family transcriptional regulator n=1 Tax=Curtobacterium sp. MCLR17_007 TaxID=2175648 RepID=UPI000DA7F6C4|nr:TetR/AcrR family transcriptional regulator [Curtobacterium sp. MCLR17_007]WIB59775.1 TetR/AcrR family transcriptional regulator [Curtobacterium sp. MCLR17_007]
METSVRDSADNRKRRSPDERRQEIISATTALIAESGYANATLTEIAQRAGVSKGLLWHYFRDRADLMHQAVTLLAGQLRAGLVADVDVTAPADQVIRAVFARTAMFTRTHRHEIEALDQIVHNLRSPDGRRRITMLDYEDIHAEHAALLARGQSEGSIRAGDVRLFAVTYQALIDGMIAHLQAHPEADPISCSHQVATVFLLGTAQPGEPSDDPVRGGVRDSDPTSNSAARPDGEATA